MDAINMFDQGIRRVRNLYGDKTDLLPNEQANNTWVLKCYGKPLAFVIVEYIGGVFEIGGGRLKTSEPTEALSYVKTMLDEMRLQD